LRKGQITIGLFDSGVGGLSVLRQLESHVNSFPEVSNYRILYLGDTARLPYGNRSAAEIKNFVEEIISWLTAKGADSIVMACNTSAALAGTFAQSFSTVPVYDLIGPTAEHLAKFVQSDKQTKQKIGVLATHSTVKSQAFSKTIKEFSSDLEVVEIACPELVQLVESGDFNSETTTKTLAKYTSQLEKAGVDAVVLGCTHYPFLAGAISALLPAHVQLVDPAAIMVRSLAKNQTLDIEDEPIVTRELYCTGPIADFAASAQICLGQSPGTVYGITVQDLQAYKGTNFAPANKVADRSGAIS